MYFFNYYFPLNLQSVTGTVNTTFSDLNESGIPEVETTEKNKAISRQRTQKTNVLYSASQEATAVQAKL